VQFRNDFVTKYKTEDPAVTLNTPAAPLEDFVKEAASMWLTSSAASDPWMRTGNPDPYNGGYSAVPVPQFNPSKPATIVYGQSALISARSAPEKQIASQAFLAEALADSTEWLTRVGVVSPTKRLRESQAAKSYPYMDTFLTDLERSRFVPRITQYPEVRDAFGRAVDRVVFNKVDVKQSLDEFCTDVDRTLGAR
jgi:maltose-binding protein MalE